MLFLLKLLAWLNSLIYRFSFMFKQYLGKDKSEQLFEDYLRERGYKYKYESGETKKPDYWVLAPVQEIVCEVHRIEAPTSVPKSGTFNPYVKLRKAINEKRKQGTEVKGKHPYVLVLDIRDILVVRTPMFVFGSMYGNIAMTMDISIENQEKTKPPEAVFSREGKMRWETPSGHADIRNTRFSAVAILEEINPTQAILDREISKALDHKDLSAKDLKKELELKVPIMQRITQEMESKGFYKPNLIIPRLKVFHNNPYAKVLLDTRIFSSKYDEQYGIDLDTGRIKKVKEGEVLKQT